MAKDNSELREVAEVRRMNVGGVETVIIQCSECGFEVDRVENDDPDDSTVKKILAKKVEDRPKNTYECPNGHNKGLEVR